MTPANTPEQFPKSDHDLLITLNAKIDLFLDKLENIPSKCIMHDEEFKAQKVETDTLKDRIKKVEDTLTINYKLAVGAALTAFGTLAAGIILFFITHPI